MLFALPLNRKSPWGKDLNIKTLSFPLHCRYNIILSHTLAQLSPTLSCVCVCVWGGGGGGMVTNDWCITWNVSKLDTIAAIKEKIHTTRTHYKREKKCINAFHQIGPKTFI